LTRLGYKDQRRKKAVDVALAAQGADGKWTPGGTFDGGFQMNIEEKGKPGRWITLGALTALNNYCRQN
jgi:hypothetical protein